MKNNYEVLNNVNIDLDEYQDINIDYLMQVRQWEQIRIMQEQPE